MKNDFVIMDPKVKERSNPNRKGSSQNVNKPSHAKQIEEEKVSDDNHE